MDSPETAEETTLSQSETEQRTTKRSSSTLSSFFTKHKHITFPEKVWCYAGLIFLLLFSLMLALSLDASLFIVLIGLSPSFATVLFSFLTIEHTRGKMRLAVWVLPIIFSVAFYITRDAPYTEGLDVTSLSAFNFLLSLIFVIILSLLHDILGLFDRLVGRITKKQKDETFTATRRKLEQHVLSQHNLSRPQRLREYVRSLEDKSKALNAVIGRVYGSYKGGHAAMRNLIKIDSQWYNEYSALDKDEETPEQLETARTLLGLIQERLSLMRKTEREVFGEDCDTLMNLERDQNGGSRIIDILIWNDKDPVEQYYRGAVEAVHRALEELR